MLTFEKAKKAMVRHLHYRRIRNGYVRSCQVVKSLQHPYDKNSCILLVKSKVGGCGYYWVIGVTLTGEKAYAFDYGTSTAQYRNLQFAELRLAEVLAVIDIAYKNAKKIQKLTDAVSFSTKRVENLYKVGKPSREWFDSQVGTWFKPQMPLRKETFIYHRISKDGKDGYSAVVARYGKLGPNGLSIYDDRGVARVATREEALYYCVPMNQRDSWYDKDVLAIRLRYNEKTAEEKAKKEAEELEKRLKIKQEYRRKKAELAQIERERLEREKEAECLKSKLHKKLNQVIEDGPEEMKHMAEKLKTVDLGILLSTMEAAGIMQKCPNCGYVLNS